MQHDPRDQVIDLGDAVIQTKGAGVFGLDEIELPQTSAGLADD